MEAVHKDGGCRQVWRLIIRKKDGDRDDRKLTGMEKLQGFRY
jgi:hypothetical protein